MIKINVEEKKNTKIIGVLLKINENNEKEVWLYDERSENIICFSSKYIFPTCIPTYNCEGDSFFDNSGKKEDWDNFLEEMGYDKYYTIERYLTKDNLDIGISIRIK